MKNITTKKPIIGITLDSENDGIYSKFPWYAIRYNYLHSIEKLGGVPFPLFHSIENISEFIEIIDGVIITGGNFDIDPRLYGQKNNNSRNQKKIKTEFELKLCQICIDKNIPLLGICGGEQVINVCQGGTLIQDIKNLKIRKLEHEQKNPRDQTSHRINIEKNTKLYKIVNKTSIMVNSAHHQAVDRLGKNLIVSSKSSDGIVESIEKIDHKWCLGLQWHPEFLITNSDKLIILDFIKASLLKL